MSASSDVFPTGEEGHAVAPLRSCPHTSACAAQTDVDLGSRGPICAACPAKDEVWICATCGSIGCSRFQAGHAEVHARATGHHIAVSWADMSVWCYACEAYLDCFVIPDLHHVFRQVYVQRFHEEPALPVIRLTADAGDGDGPGGAGLASAAPAPAADAGAAAASAHAEPSASASAASSAAAGAAPAGSPTGPKM